MTEPATLFARGGRALFGRQYVTELAEVLGCNERSVRRWAKGQRQVPADKVEALRRLVAERMAQLDEIRELLA